MKHPFDLRDEAQALMSDQIGALETTIDELTAENAKLRTWLRDLAIEADRAAYALRQKNEFSTGIAIQLLESSVKETARLMSTLNLDSPDEEGGGDE